MKLFRGEFRMGGYCLPNGQYVCTSSEITLRVEQEKSGNGDSQDVPLEPKKPGGVKE